MASSGSSKCTAIPIRLAIGCLATTRGLELPALHRLDGRLIEVDVRPCARRTSRSRCRRPRSSTLSTTVGCSPWLRCETGYTGGGLSSTRGGTSSRVQRAPQHRQRWRRVVGAPASADERPASRSRSARRVGLCAGRTEPARAAHKTPAWICNWFASSSCELARFAGHSSEFKTLHALVKRRILQSVCKEESDRHVADARPAISTRMRVRSSHARERPRSVRSSHAHVVALDVHVVTQAHATSSIRARPTRRQRVMGVRVGSHAERAATWLSLACAVHCLLMPIAIGRHAAARRVGRHASRFYRRVRPDLLVIVSALLGVTWGYRRHRDTARRVRHRRRPRRLPDGARARRGRVFAESWYGIGLAVLGALTLAAQLVSECPPVARVRSTPATRRQLRTLNTRREGCRAAGACSRDFQSSTRFEK